MRILAHRLKLSSGYDYENNKMFFFNWEYKGYEAGTTLHLRKFKAHWQRRWISKITRSGEVLFHFFGRIALRIWYVSPIKLAVYRALSTIGYHAPFKIEAFRTTYKGLPKWMGNRKHPIWYVIIHHWNPENESWKKYGNVVATRIHNLLAKEGFSARVELRRD